MMMETLPSGTVLHGRYRIERVLGSGGFGHVYLAVDLQTNQQYAIKEYLVTGASGKAQLEHEARVLSQLHHPNLPAFQAAFDERGRYYVVLGYIEGNDLTDYIRVVRQRNEVVPLARIMTWIISICDAVTFLHRQNLLRGKCLYPCLYFPGFVVTDLLEQPQTCFSMLASFPSLLLLQGNVRQPIVRTRQHLRVALVLCIQCEHLQEMLASSIELAVEEPEFTPRR